MQYQQTPRAGIKLARFPNRIREYRLAAHLSQRALGAEVGRTRSAISRWERGYSLPSVPELFKLARSLSTLGESLYIGLYSLHRREQPGGKLTPPT